MSDPLQKEPNSLQKEPGSVKTAPEAIKTEIGCLTVDAYCALVEAVGWQRRSHRDASLLLSNAIVTVVAIKNGVAVGMGRASGDGQSYAHLTDIAVHPDFRGQRIGSAILKALLDEIDNLSGAQAVVTLNTEASKIGFYARFGFVRSETPTFLVRPRLLGSA
ncbi:MAG: GNAT family N-acetyltransferase [Parvibaculum sp.]